MIVLVGFMGAGKSSVGARLAARLGLGFVDVDARVEAETGRTIAQLFADDGEAAFRTRERETIAAVLGDEAAVVALGGGAVEDPETRARLADHRVVYLATDLATIRRRVGRDPGRPLLRRGDLGARLARRQPNYAAVADVTVDTSDRSIGEVVDEIVAALDTLGD